MVKPQELAKRHNISLGTVYNIVSKTKDPAILAQAETYEQRIVERLMRNAEYGLDVVYEEVLRNPKAPAQAKINAVKMSHEIHRVETNQPTQIIRDQKSPFEFAIEFAKLIIAKHPDPEEARMLFGMATTARVGSERARKNGSRRRP